MSQETITQTAQPVSASTSSAYWEQRLRALDGLEGVGYTALGPAFNEWMYKVRRHVFRQRIASLNIDYAKSRVLDVGSGTGFWLQEWKSLGVKDLTGSDLTAVAVERLRAKFPGYAVLGLDITAPEARAIAKGTFDVISAFDVLFHIVSDTAFRSAITNVSALLSPGGLFLFSENLPHQETDRSQNQVNRTLKTISKELSAGGLKILFRVPMFVLMNAPVDAGRFARIAWWAFMRPVAHWHTIGNLYGPFLFPLETFLLDRVKEGPSTELVVCQKV